MTTTKAKAKTTIEIKRPTLVTMLGSLNYLVSFLDDVEQYKGMAHYEQMKTNAEQHLRGALEMMATVLTGHHKMAYLQPVVVELRGLLAAEGSTDQKATILLEKYGK